MQEGDLSELSLQGSVKITVRHVKYQNRALVTELSSKTAKNLVLMQRDKYSQVRT